MPSPIHTTRDGARLPISKMTNEHLLNTIRRQLKLAKEGVEVMGGGCGPDPDDMWFVVDTLFDEDALEFMNHAKYLREAKKRGLKP